MGIIGITLGVLVVLMGLAFALYGGFSQHSSRLGLAGVGMVIMSIGGTVARQQFEGVTSPSLLIDAFVWTVLVAGLALMAADFVEHARRTKSEIGI